MVVGLCCCAFFTRAQEIPSEVSVVPPSPEVSALNKYTEVPVGKYTGVPNIAVPIYTIQMQQLSLPISLSYHASGLKVEEYASWVGAGWSLNAGGTVNRSVRGLPDEFLPGLNAGAKGKKGYFYNHKLFQENQRIDPYWLDVDDGEYDPIVTPAGPITTPDSLAMGYLGVQPDLYNFSYPGGSGKFVFSRSGEIVRFSKDDTKFIEHPFDGPTWPKAGYIPSSTGYVWILEAADGTRYKYAKPETTLTHGGCGVTAPENSEPDFAHQSAWRLEEISLNGEWIRFEYVTEEILYSMKTSVSENFKVDGSGTASTSTCTSTLETKTQRLSRIYTSNGIEVKFIANNDRLDLPGSHNLQRIEVRHGSEDVAFHKLHHGYFGTDKKLKLMSINRENADSTAALPGQTFSYFEDTPMPALNSTSQDFWGFNNGANNGAFMIPPYKKDQYHLNQASTVNRDPELSNARIGTLEKITYPTGGSTTFEYELNSYFDQNHEKTYTREVTAQGTDTQQDTETTLPFDISHDTHMTLTTVGVGGQLLKLVGSDYQVVTNPTPEGNRFVLPAGTYKLSATSINTSVASIKIEYEQEEPWTVVAGGLRIKRISTLDPETGDLIKKSYEYQQEGSDESSGRLFAPLILGGDLISHTTGIETRAVTFEGQGDGNPVYGDIIGCDDDETVTSISLKSVSQLPSTFYHGSHIGYSRVMEYAGDENVTIRGTEYPNGATVSEFINEVPAHNLGDPFVPTIDLGHKNGKLLKQTVFRNAVGAANEPILEAVSQMEHIYEELAFDGERVFSMGYTRKNTFHCYTNPNSTDYIHNYYELKPSWHRLTQTIERQFYNEGNMETSSLYEYPDGASIPYFMYDSKQWDDSQGRVYREEVSRDTDHPALVLKSELKKDNQLVGGKAVTYNGKLPAEVSAMSVADGSYRLVRRYSYAGNQLQLTEDFPQAHIPNTEALGQEKRYIWAYNNSVPVAEIVGYLNGADPIAISGISQSVLDNPASESELLNELAKLRGLNAEGKPLLPGTLITTYSYKRGVGIRTVTDPNGFTTSYFYDAFNRLVKVEDQEGNIIQTNQYHYKGQ